MEQVPTKDWRVFKIYFFIIALDSISFGLIAPILAPLLLHPSAFFSVHHSSFFDHCLYGLLITFFPLMFMIGAPILGALSDKLGRKKILLFCLVTMLAAFVCYTLAFIFRNVWILIFARMLAGLSAGSQGVAQAAVAELAPKNVKPAIMSTIAVGMTLGLAIGPLIASFWTHTVVWAPFFVIILLNLCAVFLLVFYIENDSPTTALKKQIRWKNIFCNSSVLQLLGIFLFFELGWSLFYQAIPIRLNMEWHMQAQGIGLSSSYVGVMLALCLLIAMRMGMKFTSLNNLVKIGFFLGVGAFMFESTDVSFVGFLLFVFPIVFAVSLIYPSLISQLSEMVEPHEQGLIMGITNALLAFSFAVTGMLSSFLAYLNITLPFLVAALCWTIAGVWCFKKRKYYAALSRCR